MNQNCYIGEWTRGARNWLLIFSQLNYHGWWSKIQNKNPRGPHRPILRAAMHFRLTIHRYLILTIDNILKRQHQIDNDHPKCGSRENREAQNGCVSERPGLQSARKLNPAFWANCESHSNPKRKVLQIGVSTFFYLTGPYLSESPYCSVVLVCPVTK